MGEQDPGGRDIMAGGKSRGKRFALENAGSKAPHDVRGPHADNRRSVYGVSLAFAADGMESSLPVQLHVALDADRADPECPANLRLLGAACDIKLAGDHAEGAPVIHIVHEYRHIAIKKGEAITLTFVTKIVVDQGHVLVKNRQLELRHGNTSPG